MIRFSPVIPTEAELLIDLSRWREDVGRSGGFGTAWFNPDTPGDILNRLHGTVPRVDSLRRKAECAGHARAIIPRLTEIIDRDDLKKPSRFVKAMCKTLLDTVTTHVSYDQGSQGILLYQKLA